MINLTHHEFNKLYNCNLKPNYKLYQKEELIKNRLDNFVSVSFEKTLFKEDEILICIFDNFDKDGFYLILKK